MINDKYIQYLAAFRWSLHGTLVRSPRAAISKKETIPDITQHMHKYSKTRKKGLPASLINDLKLYLYTEITLWKSAKTKVSTIFLWTIFFQIVNEVHQRIKIISPGCVLLPYWTNEIYPSSSLIIEKFFFSLSVPFFGPDFSARSCFC